MSVSNRAVSLEELVVMLRGLGLEVSGGVGEVQGVGSVAKIRDSGICESGDVIRQGTEEPKVAVDGEVSSDGSVAASDVTASSWADQVDEALAVEARGEAIRKTDQDSGVRADSSDSNGVAAAAQSGGAVEVGLATYASVVGRSDPPVAVATEKGVQPSFFGTYVNTPNAKGLKQELTRLVGRRFPRNAKLDLAIATHTSGTVPQAIACGRDKLKQLELLGDSVVAYVLIRMHVMRGVSVERAQALKTTVLSNTRMSAAFASSVLSTYVSVPAGVNIVTSKVGANCLEVIIGLLDTWFGPMAVERFCIRIGLFPALSNRRVDVPCVTEGSLIDLAVDAGGVTSVKGNLAPERVW